MEDKQDYYVYEWIRLDTLDPFYVGVGRRFRYLNKVNRTTKFKEVSDNVDCMVRIVRGDLPKEKAYEMEIYLIWYYDEVMGYELTNIATGGNSASGYRHTDKARNNISIKRKGWNPSEETREKMRNNAIRNNAVSNLEQKRFKKGNIPWNKGRKSTDEERLKLSLAHVGKSIPPEQIEKIRVSTQRTYDNMLKERFPEEYYTNIKTLLKTKMLKKDICEELSITMHHMRRILTVYERD